jgi:hypothetical protein
VAFILVVTMIGTGFVVACALAIALVGGDVAGAMNGKP